MKIFSLNGRRKYLNLYYFSKLVNKAIDFPNASLLPRNFNESTEVQNARCRIATIGAYTCDDLYLLKSRARVVMVVEFELIQVMVVNGSLRCNLNISKWPPVWQCEAKTSLVPRPHPLRGKGSGGYRAISWPCRRIQACD